MSHLFITRAFGGKPGDARWNQVADTDMNEIINVVDIARMTKDPGETENPQ